MAAGQITLFEEFSADIGNSVHDLTDDDIRVAIITTEPSASASGPTLNDFTQVSGGNYVANGYQLNPASEMSFVQSGGTGTWDTSQNPTWAQDNANPTNALAGLIYNFTNGGTSGICIGYIQLAGATSTFETVDMSAGALTITWDAAGILTIS